MILTDFTAAGCWKPGVSFGLAAPMQLSSCLGESWEAVSAHKELQNEGISGVFDQKLVILGLTFFLRMIIFIKLSKQKQLAEMIFSC